MKTRTMKLVGLALAGALALSACGNSDNGDAAKGGDANAVITVNATEPQHPLIPGITNEVGGGRILNMINAGLVYYKADGSTENELAESIEPNENNSLFTIKLKKI
ncbi:hypothetical protein RQN30_04995 [Arcanobacterium hippocoleae]